MDPVTETPTEPVDYAALNGVWAALMAGLVLATREDAPPASELPVLGLATFAMSKAVAKEKVGTWARAPLVDEGSPDRRPKGRRLRYAVGELVTCTRCLGPWAASVVTFGQALAPRHARVITRVMALAGANTLLQATQSLAQECSNAAARGWQPPTQDED